MSALKYGFVLPSAEARRAGELAREAEQAGWDGFFFPEYVWHIDAWVCMAVAAVCTERIRLGTMLTPMPRMKPWKLASESATLDKLSNGRLILSLGMGAIWMGYQGFPDEVTDTRIRAELLDEGIDVLTLLWQGKPFDYDGKHYHLKLTALDEQYYPSPPVQQPRIPLWVVGVWPRTKSMQRVLRCDGLLPNRINDEGQLVEVRPEDLRQMKTYVEANRALTTPFDFIADGHTLGLDRARIEDKLWPWVEAGATWWIESPFGVSEEEVLARLRQGPPSL